MKDFFLYRFYRFSDWLSSFSPSTSSDTILSSFQSDNIGTRVEALAEKIIESAKNPNSGKQEQNTTEYKSLVEALGNGNAKKGELYLKNDLNDKINLKLLTTGVSDYRQKLKEAQSKLKELEARFKTSQQNQGSSHQNHSPITAFTPPEVEQPKALGTISRGPDGRFSVGNSGAERREKTFMEQQKENINNYPSRNNHNETYNRDVMRAVLSANKAQASTTVVQMQGGRQYGDRVI